MKPTSPTAKRLIKAGWRFHAKVKRGCYTTLLWFCPYGDIYTQSHAIALVRANAKTRQMREAKSC